MPAERAPSADDENAPRPWSRDPQFEVLPLPGISDLAGAHLPAGARVTVTASPAQGLSATVTTAGELAGRGFTVIPHLAARMVPDERTADRIVERLGSAGVREVFVIGGDAPQPAGSFSDALDLLRVLPTDPALTIGIGAHPEGHPFLDDESADRLLRTKAEHASYMVTQMCFDATALLDWVRRIRAQGIVLPVRPGIAAPVGAVRLARLGARIGVGRSLRLLTSSSTGVRRMMGPRTWQPDELLDQLAPAYGDPELGLAGPHVYTFNALATVQDWWPTEAPHRPSAG